MCLLLGCSNWNNRITKTRTEYKHAVISTGIWFIIFVVYKEYQVALYVCCTGQYIHWTPQCVTKLCNLYCIGKCLRTFGNISALHVPDKALLESSNLCLTVHVTCWDRLAFQGIGSSCGLPELLKSWWVSQGCSLSSLEHCSPYSFPRARLWNALNFTLAGVWHKWHDSFLGSWQAMELDLCKHITTEDHAGCKYNHFPLHQLDCCAFST